MHAQVEVVERGSIYSLLEAAVDETAVMEVLDSVAQVQRKWVQRHLE